MSTAESPVRLCSGSRSGGWKRSAIGPGAKAGGPNYLIGLSNWKSSRAAIDGTVTNPLVKELLGLAAVAGLPSAITNSLHRGAESDQKSLDRIFSKLTDPSGLAVERNVFRYLRSDCVLRIGSGAAESEIWRALLSLGTLDHGTLSAAALPNPIVEAFQRAGFEVRIETDAKFAEALTKQPSRVRLVGNLTSEGNLSLNANPGIAVYDHPPTESGQIEMLPYFHEQAVSITAHRFGNPSRLAHRVLKINH